MSDTDEGYFVRRAERQLELAQAARHRKVVQAHYELANLYLDIAYRGGEPLPDSPDVPEVA